MTEVYDHAGIDDWLDQTLTSQISTLRATNPIIVLVCAERIFAWLGCDAVY